MIYKYIHSPIYCLKVDERLAFGTRPITHIRGHTVDGDIVYTLPGNHHHTMNLLVANVPLAQCGQCSLGSHRSSHPVTTNFSSEVKTTQISTQSHVKRYRKSAAESQEPRESVHRGKKSTMSAYSELDCSRCIMCGKLFLADESESRNFNSEKVLIYVSGEHDQLTLHKLCDLPKRLEYIRSSKSTTAQSKLSKPTQKYERPSATKNGFAGNKVLRRGSGDHLSVAGGDKWRISADSDPQVAPEAGDMGDGISLEMVGHKWSMPNLSQLETPTLMPDFQNYYISGLSLSPDHR